VPSRPTPKGGVELTTVHSLGIATGTYAMVRKIVRIAKGRRSESESERLLEMRRTVNEYVAFVAITVHRKRPRPKRSVTVIVK
jgi:hypothetical protein